MTPAEGKGAPVRAASWPFPLSRTLDATVLTLEVADDLGTYPRFRPQRTPWAYCSSYPPLFCGRAVLAVSLTSLVHGYRFSLGARDQAR